MDQPPGHSFPPALRLRTRREYLHLRERGKKFHTPHFLVLVFPNSGDLSRIGITASRKVGGAVERNRVKRVVREFFRNHRICFPRGVDYSVIAKKGASTLRYCDVCRELEAMCNVSPDPRP